jgi:hypothetical protein
MNWNWKEQRKQKNQFKSYYCFGCKQKKPCQLLTGWDNKWKNYCCWCYYQSEQERGEEYSSYEKFFASKKQEQKARFQQFQLLKNYSGCKTCGSLEVDAYSLYHESRLFCQPCLLKKENGASSPLSFLEQQKWFRKHWLINLTEWLENFLRLPVNKNCAKMWWADKQRLNNCDCLEAETKETYLLFTNSLKRIETQLKDCKCVTSKKVRVSSDYYVRCEICGATVPVASKKRVIKNRNDPKFWGLNIPLKILCLNCLKLFCGEMPVSKKYVFNKYLRRDYN